MRAETKDERENCGNYETLNELLVTLFRDVMDIEQKVIITPEFKDITNNDMLCDRSDRDWRTEKYVIDCQRTVRYGGNALRLP
ncbi:MAG: hypothetical protein ACLR8P_22375 [Clostridium fessum]